MLKGVALACLVVAAAAQAPTYPPIPGMLTTSNAMGSLFMRGYDPMRGESKASVVDFTYTNMNGDWNQWINPATGKTFSLPDQVTIYNIPSSQTAYSINMFASMDDFNEYESSMSYSGFDLFVVSYSESQMNSFVRQRLSANASDVFHTQWLDTTYKMSSAWNPIIFKEEMQHGSQQNSTFAMDQAALPSTRSSEQDLAAYDAFLAKYGTHWVHDSMYGGMVQVFLTVDKEDLAGKTQKWMAEQASFSFDVIVFDFNFTHGSSGGYTNITDEFAAASDMTIYAVGGDAAAVNSGVYDTWSGTVGENPAPLNASYQPIADLIIDSTKASLYADHVKEYLSTKPSGPGNRTVCGSSVGRNSNVKDLPHKSKSSASTTRLSDYIASRTVPTPVLRGATPPAPAALKPVPGLSSGIGAGYDVKTGQFMDAVTTITYNQNKQWYNPLLKTTNSIPDSLTFVDVPSACFAESIVDIKSDETFSEFYGEYTGFSIGLDYDGFTVGVSFDQALAHYKNVTNNWQDGLSVLLRSQTLYKLAFDGNPQSFDSRFAAMMNALPNKASPLYQELIEYWGTHYVAGMELGGSCNFTVMYDQSFVKEKTWKYTEEQIGLEFGYTLKGIGITADFGFGFTKTTGKVDQQFQAESKSSYACVGGDVTYLQNKNYELWVQSILHAPAPIPHSMQLRPISELVYDPVKRSLMKDAIRTYLKA